MFYAEGSELVAEVILGEHSCGPDCVCWKLRRIPAIKEALAKLGVPKFESLRPLRAPTPA